MAKRIFITLYKTELLYDVQNKTYLTARSRDNGQDPSITANMQANNGESEANQLMRSLGNAFSLLLPKLSPYLCNVVEVKENAAGKCSCKYRTEIDTSPDDIYVTDNKLVEQADNNEFSIPLKMPDNFNDGFIGAITTALHEYMVSIATAEWFTLSNPQEAVLYYEQANIKLSEAKNYLHARIMPVKRPLSAF